MGNLKSKLILLAALFIFFGVSSFFFYYSGKPMQGVLFAQNIPSKVGDWEGTDIPMDEETMRLLETRDILFRIYRRPATPPVYFCVVFAQNNRRSIHPPEVCYIASGWEVGAKEIEPRLKATQILITKSYAKQLVYYWYKAGDELTASVAKQQLNMALNQLLLRRVRGALIRLSTEIKEETQEEAAQRLTQFASQILPLVQENLP